MSKIEDQISRGIVNRLLNFDKEQPSYNLIVYLGSIYRGVCESLNADPNEFEWTISNKYGAYPVVLVCPKSRINKTA